MSSTSSSSSSSSSAAPLREPHGPTPAISRSGTAVGDFFNLPGILPGTYPMLYPGGSVPGLKATHVGPMPHALARHFAAQYTNAFSTPACSFLAFLGDLLLRWKRCQANAAFLKSHPTSKTWLAAFINGGDAEARLRAAEANPTSAAARELCRQIALHIRHMNATVPWSSEQRKGTKPSMFAGAGAFGSASVLLTVAPNPTTDPNVLRETYPVFDNFSFPAFPGLLPQHLLRPRDKYTEHPFFYPQAVTFAYEDSAGAVQEMVGGGAAAPQAVAEAGAAGPQAAEEGGAGAPPPPPAPRAPAIPGRPVSFSLTHNEMQSQAASSPYACVMDAMQKFRAALQELFCVRAASQRNCTPLDANLECGLLGKIRYYFKVVEENARHYHHMHVLAVCDSLSPGMLRLVGASPVFLARIISSLDSMLRAQVPVRSHIRQQLTTLLKRPATRAGALPIPATAREASSLADTVMVTGGTHVHHPNCGAAPAGATYCRGGYKQNPQPCTAVLAVLPSTSSALGNPDVIVEIQSAPEGPISFTRGLEAEPALLSSLPLVAPGWVARDVSVENPVVPPTPTNGCFLLPVCARPSTEEDKAAVAIIVGMLKSMEGNAELGGMEGALKAMSAKGESEFVGFARYLAAQNCNLVQTSPTLAAALRCNTSIELCGDNAIMYVAKYMSKSEEGFEVTHVPLLRAALTSAEAHPGEAEDAGSPIRRVLLCLAKFVNRKAVGQPQSLTMLISAALGLEPHECGVGTRLFFASAYSALRKKLYLAYNVRAGPGAPAAADPFDSASDSESSEEEGEEERDAREEAAFLCAVEVGGGTPAPVVDGAGQAEDKAESVAEGGGNPAPKMRVKKPREPRDFGSSKLYTLADGTIVCVSPEDLYAARGRDLESVTSLEFSANYRLQGIAQKDKKKASSKAAAERRDSEHTRVNRAGAGRPSLSTYTLDPACPLVDDYELVPVEKTGIPQVVGKRPPHPGPYPAGEGGAADAAAAGGADAEDAAAAAAAALRRLREQKRWVRQRDAWTEFFFALFVPWDIHTVFAPRTRAGAYKEAQVAVALLRRQANEGGPRGEVALGRLWTLGCIPLPIRPTTVEERLVTQKYRMASALRWKVADRPTLLGVFGSSARAPPISARGNSDPDSERLGKEDNSGQLERILGILARVQEALGASDSLPGAQRAAAAARAVESRVLSMKNITQGLVTGAYNPYPPALQAALAGMPADALGGGLGGGSMGGGGADQRPPAVLFSIARAKDMKIAADRLAQKPDYVEFAGRAREGLWALGYRCTGVPNLGIPVPLKRNKSGIAANPVEEARVKKSVQAYREALFDVMFGDEAMAERDRVEKGEAPRDGFSRLSRCSPAHLSAVYDLLMWTADFWEALVLTGAPPTRHAPKIMVMAGGGVGKSFLFMAARDATANAHSLWVSAAWTGSASVLMGGETLARLFGLVKFGSKVIPQLTDVHSNSLKALFNALLGACVLWIDELSLVSAEMLYESKMRAERAAQASLSPVKHEYDIVALLLSGDVYQVPPLGAGMKLWEAVMRSHLNLHQATPGVVDRFAALRSLPGLKPRGRSHALTVAQEGAAAIMREVHAYTLEGETSKRVGKGALADFALQARGEKPLFTPPLLLQFANRKVGSAKMPPPTVPGAPPLEATALLVTFSHLLCQAANCARLKELARLLGTPILSFPMTLVNTGKSEVARAEVKRLRECAGEQLHWFVFPGCPLVGTANVNVLGAGAAKGSRGLMVGWPIWNTSTNPKLELELHEAMERLGRAGPGEVVHADLPLPSYFNACLADLATGAPIPEHNLAPGFPAGSNVVTIGSGARSDTMAVHVAIPGSGENGKVDVLQMPYIPSVATTVDSAQGYSFPAAILDPNKLPGYETLCTAARLYVMFTRPQDLDRTLILPGDWSYLLGLRHSNIIVSFCAGFEGMGQPWDGEAAMQKMVVLTREAPEESEGKGAAGGGACAAPSAPRPSAAASKGRGGSKAPKGAAAPAVAPAALALPAPVRGIARPEGENLCWLITLIHLVGAAEGVLGGLGALGVSATVSAHPHVFALVHAGLFGGSALGADSLRYLATCLCRAAPAQLPAAAFPPDLDDGVVVSPPSPAAAARAQTAGRRAARLASRDAKLTHDISEMAAKVFALLGADHGRYRAKSQFHVAHLGPPAPCRHYVDPATVVDKGAFDSSVYTLESTAVRECCAHPGAHAAMGGAAAPPPKTSLPPPGRSWAWELVPGHDAPPPPRA